MEDLIDKYDRCGILNMSPQRFDEPDLNNEMTAFAIRTDLDGKKKLSNFGLLREKDLCHPIVA